MSLSAVWDWDLKGFAILYPGEIWYNYFDRILLADSRLPISNLYIND